MSSSTDRFIEVATKPFSDNVEMKLAAEVELRRHIDGNKTSPPEIEQATSALEQADRNRNRKWWWRMLLFASAAASIATMVEFARQLQDIASQRVVASMDAENSIFKPLLIEGITPEQKLLIFGTPGATPKSNRWKSLWESDRDSPSYFTQYASEQLTRNNTQAKELLAEAETIDPGNGWLHAVAAASEADEVVAKEKRGSNQQRRESANWRIINPERLTDALQQIHHAAGKSRFQSYQSSLMDQRISLLKPRTDFSSQSRLHAFGLVYSNPSIPLRKLADLWSAGAQECATRGDVDGFHQIISDWNVLTESMAGNGVNLVDQLVAKATYNSPSANFRDAAIKLGLKAEATRFAAINDAFAESYESKKRGSRRQTSSDAFVSRGSLLAGLSLPLLTSQVKSPPPVTEDDLKPGRLADHALFERVCSLAAWILFGAAAGLATLHRFRHGDSCHRLAARLKLLATPVDWIILISGGVLLPLLCYLTVTRFTPLSFRDWSLRWTVFMVPALQVGAFVTSMLVLPVVIARWRLDKRAGFLGFQSKHMWAGAFAAISSLIAIPTAGLAHLAGSEWVLIPIGLPIVFPLVWLLTGLFTAVFGRSETALRREIIALWALPVWVTGMLMMAAGAPLLYKSEQYWIQRDKLMEITAETHGVSRYEWLVTRQLRKELMEMMERTR